MSNNYSVITVIYLWYSYVVKVKKNECSIKNCCCISSTLQYHELKGNSNGKHNAICKFYLVIKNNTVKYINKLNLYLQNLWSEFI